MLDSNYEYFELPSSVERAAKEYFKNGRNEDDENKIRSSRYDKRYC